MLITLPPDLQFNSLKDLYPYTFALLKQQKCPHNTLVLGPVTPKNGNTLEENLCILAEHSKTLSSKGWVVLDLRSFQPEIERLLSLKKSNGYPYEVLYNFTLPLIGSGCFRTIHFRKNYYESHGALFEHALVKQLGIRIVYVE